MLNRLKEISKDESRLKLLYVEDDVFVRDATLPLLQEFFHIVHTAQDGQEGLEKFHQNNYDVVVTDTAMPNLSGLEMIEKIRVTNKEVSVIVNSAYDNIEYFLKSIELCIDGYLLKPIETSNFTSMITRVIDNIRKKKRSPRA